MTSRSLFVSAVVAATVVGLSGCGAEKPSGLALPTSSPSSHSSSRVPAPSWTSAQQQVIDTTLTYHALFSKFSKGTKLDMAALRSVATDAFAVQVGKNIVDGLDLGFIRYGDEDMHEIRAVTITGPKSTLTECWIGRSYAVNKKFSPSVTTKPLAPAISSVSLTRTAGKWLVSGFTEGPACAARG
jgi:hypothetical protein